MVDVMGRTPEEFEEMLNAQIAEAERRAAAMDEFVTTLESARVTGFDSRREVEVEINQEGAMTRVSIDDEAELEQVYQVLMDLLYEDDDTQLQ